MTQSAFGFDDGAPDHERLRTHDADFTPQGIVRQGLTVARFDLGVGHTVSPIRFLDPSSGAGVFGLEARNVFGNRSLHPLHTVGVELRSEELPWIERNYDEALVGRSFEHVDLGQARFDLIATNPPFSLFPLFLRRCRPLLDDCGYLMMLGLSTWGQSAEGAELFAEHPPIYQYRITGRIGFRGPGTNPKTKKPWGTDQRDYSWWVWTSDVSSGLRGELCWFTRNLPTLPTAQRTWRVKPGTVDELGPMVATEPDRQSFAPAP